MKIVNSLSCFFKCALTCISPKLNTKVLYRIKFGKKLDLKNPVTLNEKLLYLKLSRYNSDPVVKQCADKYAVREYITQKGCEDCLNDLIAAYDSVDEIRWDELPDQFAMKWNFGCGFNIICDDKSRLDIAAAEKKLKKWGKTKSYLPYSEMQYKGVKKKIIVEKYLAPANGRLPDDYKFYCFNGEPKYVMLCVGRENGHPKYYFFDREWNLCRINKDSIAAPEDFSLPKPDGVDRAFALAEKLSADFPFVRADFYIVDGTVYFGELTFTPAGSMDNNRLPETDVLMGNMLRLEN